MSDMTSHRKGSVLARLAAQLCAQPAFQKWLDCDSAAHAAQVIRVVCQVTSRSQLDYDVAAARLFHKHIRGPWIKRAPFVSPSRPHTE